MEQALRDPFRAYVKRLDIVDVISQLAPLVFLVTLIIVFGTLNSKFLKPVNLLNVLQQVSITGLMAIGMTYVIITSGIDLSVGSLLAFSGVVCAAVAKGGRESWLSGTTTEQGYGVTLAALAAIGIGMTGGLIQGTAITRLGVPPFVVTLGGMSAFRGATLLFSHGGPISGFTKDFRYWGSGKVFGDVIPGNFFGDGIPVLAIIFLSFAVIAHIILRYTRYGRHVYAVGANPEAARLSGLNVKLIVLSVYVILGFFCGLCGFLQAARVNSAEAVAGTGFELTVIASVVIGGTSLFGGEGGIFGTVVGAVLIGVLTNGLVLMQVQTYYQQIILGAIIVFAVAFDRFIKSKRRV
ncbi:MAG: ABC transporter permease [Chloroflexi bacterium]|nr:MAG: ABC transporter permease [Chloroflexota bacterium]